MRTLFRSVLCCATLVGLAATAAASESFIKPGRQYAVIDSEHIHALVPAHQVEQLKPFIARADVIYQRIAKDAGYVIDKRLNLMLSDDEETHNGFSTVTPFPIINIELAPATQSSFIFTGANQLERTLVHELTHHVSNDRSFGFRYVLERIFGRIVPNDVVSLLFAYLSTPSHQTMPSFWHEGCAQWVETVYAPPGSPWGGRGRDSLTHMVWRLDAASPAGIPKPADWRITYQRWPFGTRSYLYGVAYTRYLDGAYRNDATIWQLIERQEHRWAFAFNGGPEELLAASHDELITEARTALTREQEEQLRILRTQPTTTTKRLTPENARVAAPAWTPDGRLFVALDDPFARPGFAYVDAAGDVSKTAWSAYALGDARSTPDGSIIFDETPTDSNPWQRSRLTIITPDGDSYRLPGRRMLQADLRRASGDQRFEVAAIRLLPAARQELVISAIALHDRWFRADAEVDWRTFPTEGTAWSPAYRPGHDELSWVETDATGSRLMLAPLSDPTKRTVLAHVTGRIIRPAWTRTGDRVFVCADHSGVSNAYAIDPSVPDELIPVTNTIGGVIACIPKPDGSELALIDYDSKGPYLARVPNDPASWPKQVPKLTLAFPAPVAGAKTRTWARGPAAGSGTALADAADPDGGADTRFTLPPDSGDVSKLTSHRYHGVLEIRPLFWTPTSYVVPEGGFGAVAAAADPLLTHTIVASGGFGPIDGKFVGLAGYTFGAWPLDLTLVGFRSQRLYDDQVIDIAGNEYAYGERVDSAEARIGYGLAGFRRRHEAYLAAGIADHDPVKLTEDDYRGATLVSLPPFIGRERYLEATVAYDDSTFFPTSYTREDGDTLAVSYRHSGFGGDKEEDRVIARGTRVQTVWPSQSHQIVVGGILGWSEGDRYLQGDFTIGGSTSVNTLPRGYPKTEAVGFYLLGGSGAYRLPIWRPFTGFKTSPFVFRQVVLEAFYDVAKVSPDRIGGSGRWYRSVGGELHLQWEVWYVLLDPGLGVAQQLDADKDLTAYFTLQYGW
ncbi:MAG: hypothetical protein H0V44_04005 [Planctomycetes bacterium]|nr:hypothetical protein [Planctomycetota bacterium]